MVGTGSKKVSPWVWGGVGCGGGILLVLLVVFFVNLFPSQWALEIDDGPFKGEERSSYPTGTANQEKKIWQGMVLKVYDKQGEDPAPTVMLQDKKGDILWCIYATGDKNTVVDKMRFQWASPFAKGYIRGWVDWTYGGEVMWWLIEDSGRLEGYWYSW